MASEAIDNTGTIFGKQGKLFENTGESTDIALMVDALAQEESSPWDASRIRDALVIEAGVDPATAEGIALEGMLRADNEREAARQLERRGLAVIEVRSGEAGSGRRRPGGVCRLRLSAWPGCCCRAAYRRAGWAWSFSCRRCRSKRRGRRQAMPGSTCSMSVRGLQLSSVRRGTRCSTIPGPVTAPKRMPVCA